MSKEDLLRALIKTKYRSIRKLSEASGVPGSTISSMLTNGVDGTGIRTVLKICKALGIKPDDLENHDDLSSLNAKNDELSDYLDILHKRPEMQALFSIAKNAKKEDVEKAIKIIEMLKDGQNT